MEPGYFNVTDQVKIGQPDVDPAMTVAVQLKVYGEYQNFIIPIKYKFTDPVRGELYEPLVLLPPLVVAPDEHVKMSIDNNKFEGTLSITANKKNITATLGDPAITQPDQPKTEYVTKKISFPEKGRPVEVSYKVDAQKDNEYTFWVLNDGTKTPLYSQEMRQVKYDHIPYINYYKKASVDNRRLDLKTYNKKIGYIPGAGDKVPEALEQMGYEVNRLTEKELSRNNLDRFDVIITGVRAYNTNDWMNKYYDKLMKYVNDGGNLIIQYNTSNNLGPVRAKIDPYNLTITRNRITDENAVVTILKPDHPAFNFPNKITDDDFKGWIQERSIYHGSDTSGKYEKLIRMNDPGEQPDDGSLMVGRYGKGWITYTGLVFFRELPAGVPGAYRLLANIIALNRKKGF